MTSDDEGEGGVRIPPKNDDVIYEQPLSNDGIGIGIGGNSIAVQCTSGI